MSLDTSLMQHQLDKEKAQLLQETGINFDESIITFCFWAFVIILAINLVIASIKAISRLREESRIYSDCIVKVEQTASTHDDYQLLKKLKGK